MVIDLNASSDIAKIINAPLDDLYNYLKDKTNNNIDKLKNSKNISKLSDRIFELQNVKTIYKGDSAINLKTFYYPSRVRAGNELVDVSHVGRISKNSNIVIQGTVGQGKSIFMRYMTSQEISLGKRIPVFFELRKLKKTKLLKAQ